MTALEQVDKLYSDVEYLKELDEYMEDERYEEALELAIKLIAKPNVPPDKVASLCVKLEALAYVFRTKFVAYQCFRKGDKSTHQKNFYKEAYTGLDNLVASLKYMLR